MRLHILIQTRKINFGPTHTIVFLSETELRGLKQHERSRGLLTELSFEAYHPWERDKNEV